MVDFVMLLVAAFAAAACVWGGVLMAALAMEHRLLFGRPRVFRSAPAGPFEGSLTQGVTLRRGGGRLEGVIARPVADALGVDGSTAHTLLVWFGGRNEDIRWSPALAGWLGQGHAVAAFAYRERPVQREVVADALHALSWLGEESQFRDVRLVLAGRSLGAAVALQVAAALPVQARLSGMVLLSPPDSVRSMVAANPLLAPAGRWMHSPFDSTRLSFDLCCPILVLLAERDDCVPHERSLRLVEHLGRLRPPGHEAELRVVVVPGTDHRSVARAASTLQTVAGFVDQLPDRRPAPWASGERRRN